LTHCLFFIAVALAGGDIIATLFTILYQRFWYKKVLRPRYSGGFSPRCSIIVPCKGLPKNFGKNLEGFLELEYPSFEVIYITESEKDPATPVIKEIVGRHVNARLVFAGLSTACAQKNFNLLAGVKEARNAEVLVFADSDIRPAKNWLSELVLPLSDPKVAVTSGYRWLHASKGTIGEQSHAFANVFIYVLFAVASFIGGVGLWGGSMAIRKKDFEDFGVAQKWGRTAVDDMSLSQLVRKKRRKGVVVPSSMTHSDELLPTARATSAWFTRQTMFLKAYFKPIWLIGGMILTIGGSTLFLLLPLAAVGAISDDRTFLSLGGGAAAVMYIGEFLAVLLYPLIGPIPRFHTFLLYMPIIRITQIVSYFKTVFSRCITWAGVRYYLTFSGDVARVERP
jgi:cellulose synthase/poly-beta-1,6-N-acetylglucosamine synthase-like glycosyltransferase